MNTAVQFYLFGTPRLEKLGKIIEIDTRKALALLAYLVLGKSGASGGLSRDTLAALLYPDADQSSARGALRRTLSALRKAVGEEILETNRERISIQMEPLWVDVLVFRENLEKTKQHGHAPGSACTICLQQLHECIDLYATGFMAGFSLRDSPDFDDWQFYLADSLRQELAGALEQISYELAAQGDYAAAIQMARRWLSLDPLREEAQRRLMLLYAWDGQRNAALKQYRECVRVLDQELGVAPLVETSQLYQALLENRIQPAPHDQVGASQARSYPESEFTAPVAASKPEAAESGPPASRGPDGFPLVGRSIEWESLLQAYQTTAETGYWFVLEGEAGIGKTRLAGEFMQYIQARGATVLQARCYEGETGLAYAPFLDVLNTALARPEMVTRLQGLNPTEVSPAAPLLPVLQGYFDNLTPAPDAQIPGAQARFFEAIRLVINCLLMSDENDASPGVLFLDDLQWSDASSLDLLSFLIRRMEGIFILTAWRSDLIPVDHRLRLSLAQVCREGRATSLSLPRLKPEHIADFFSALQRRQDLKPGFFEQFFAETEGNPFFIVAYAESILEQVKSSNNLSWELPRSARDLLQTRLSAVGEVNWQILTAAASIGRAFSFDVLREVSGRSETELIEGLEELLIRNLITEQWSREGRLNEARYDFTHDKIRSLVYEQTSLARRRLLHQRAAGAYAGQARQRREAWSQAAHHYQLAGQLSQAAECFRQAGEIARSLYANQEAIGHFQSALACDDPQPASLHESIGDLRSLSGEYLTAITHYETAAALCSPDQLPGVEHKLGMVHARRGDWELAECYYHSALEEIEALPMTGNLSPGRRALIYADWSLAVYRQENTSRALELADRALELAQESQNQLAIAQAFNILGILERANGNSEQAIENLERSLEIARLRNDLGAQAAALNNLARVYADTEQLERAIQLTAQALELSNQRGDRHRAAALHNNLADLHHTLGDQKLAMDHLLKAVVIFAEIEGWGEAQAGKPSPGVEDLPVLVERLPEIWKLSEW